MDPNVTGTDCWRWMGGTAGNRGPKHLKHKKPWKRYGRFRFRGRMENAHRVVLILTAGEPPTPDHVAGHVECDATLCCNPTHLGWQTQQENIQLAIFKRRLTRAPSGRFATAA